MKNQKKKVLILIPSDSEESDMENQIEELIYDLQELKIEIKVYVDEPNGQIGGPTALKKETDPEASTSKDPRKKRLMEDYYRGTIKEHKKVNENWS